MCFKIPRKKYSLFETVRLLTAFMLALTLAAIPLAVQADPDRAIFWAIQKDQLPTGYLLGTIHSEDPRVLDFSEDFLTRLKANTVFAMELVPDLPTLARLTKIMNYPQGESLEPVIGSERFAALQTALSTYNMPPGFINRLKPWAAMMTLSTPPPKTGFFMDLSLSLRASGNGSKVVGLETLEQQLSFLQDMPLSMQLELLDQAIAEFDQVNKAHDMMVETYLKNDLQVLQALVAEQFETVSEKARDYFIKSGIDARNVRMVKALSPYLEDSSVFVAVGALHLPGEKGIINLLRERGYQLTALELPFRVAGGDEP